MYLDFAETGKAPTTTLTPAAGLQGRTRDNLSGKAISPHFRNCEIERSMKLRAAEHTLALPCGNMLFVHPAQHGDARRAPLLANNVKMDWFYIAAILAPTTNYWNTSQTAKFQYMFRLEHLELFAGTLSLTVCQYFWMYVGSRFATVMREGTRAAYALRRCSACFCMRPATAFFSNCIRAKCTRTS